MNEIESHIELSRLLIRIQGRQFPEATDFWDGNWLLTCATFDSGHSRVSASGPILHLGELQQFIDQLEVLYQSLTGEAKLDCIEPNLNVLLTALTRGVVKLEVSITPDHLKEQHKFTEELDQSYLQPLIAECRSVLKKFPIREPEKLKK